MFHQKSGWKSVGPHGLRCLSCEVIALYFLNSSRSFKGDFRTGYWLSYMVISKLHFFSSILCGHLFFKSNFYSKLQNISLNRFCSLSLSFIIPHFSYNTRSVICSILAAPHFNILFYKSSPRKNSVQRECKWHKNKSIFHSKEKISKIPLTILVQELLQQPKSGLTVSQAMVELIDLGCIWWNSFPLACMNFPQG